MTKCVQNFLFNMNKSLFISFTNKVKFSVPYNLKLFFSKHSVRIHVCIQAHVQIRYDVQLLNI